LCPQAVGQGFKAPHQLDLSSTDSKGAIMPCAVLAIFARISNYFESEPIPIVWSIISIGKKIVHLCIAVSRASGVSGPATRLDPKKLINNSLRNRFSFK